MFDEVDVEGGAREQTGTERGDQLEDHREVLGGTACARDVSVSGPRCSSRPQTAIRGLAAVDGVCRIVDEAQA